MEIILWDFINMNLATSSLVVIHYLHSYILTEKDYLIREQF